MKTGYCRKTGNQNRDSKNKVKENNEIGKLH